MSLPFVIDCEIVEKNNNIKINAKCNAIFIIHIVFKVFLKQRPIQILFYNWNEMVFAMVFSFSALVSACHLCWTIQFIPLCSLLFAYDSPTMWSFLCWNFLFIFCMSYTVRTRVSIFQEFSIACSSLFTFHFYFECFFSAYSPKYTNSSSKTTLYVLIISSKYHSSLFLS